MRLEKITKDHEIYCLIAKSRYELTSSFMRIQEYYESPFEDIRGQYFTHEYYMDRYALDNLKNGKPEFSYFTDWSGFNIPSSAIAGFMNTFNDLWEKEKVIINLIQPLISKCIPYYIIGIEEGSDSIDHEIAHGLWNLNDPYKLAMTKLIESIPLNTYDQLIGALVRMGYCTDVIDDEIQAYISTSDQFYFMSHFKGVSIDDYLMQEFKNTFNKFNL